MRSSKWQAQGNTYLLVELADGERLTAGHAVELSGRERTDGVLEVTAVEAGGAEIVVWNPDGSTAELSGNGTRIAARWLAEQTGAETVRIRVGERVVTARMQQDGRVEQELGVERVAERERLDLGGEVVEVTPVSVGNPHAVLEREPDLRELRRLGPLVERHPRFPERTNVQLARVDRPGQVTALVWERGAGETPSSGTSAVAVAAATHGTEGASVVVQFPGGDLHVRIEGGQAFLTGPAERVA